MTLDSSAALAIERESSSESLRAFMELIAHELQAPLSVAHGYSDMWLAAAWVSSQRDSRPR